MAEQPFSEELHINLQETELPKPRQVLNISEMMLTVDGQYFAEVGNPSYASKPDMFTWYPDEGLSIIWGKKAGKTNVRELEPDDLMKLPHDMGYVPLSRLLPAEEITMSDREFQSKVYAIYGDIKKKIGHIAFLARELDKPFGNWTEDSSIKTAARNNSQYSPEELLDTLLNVIPQPETWDRELSLSETVKATGILDPDAQKNRDGVIRFFYLYCQLKDIDTSNPVALKEAINRFTGYDDLMDEYKNSPDSRFGDELLVACSMVQRDELQEKNDGEE